MSESAQVIANRFLPGVSFAAFGTPAVMSSGVPPLHSSMPVRHVSGQSFPDGRGDGRRAIMALTTDRIVFLHFTSPRVTADMLAVSDVDAALDTVGGRSVVRLNAARLLRDYLGRELMWEFVVDEPLRTDPSTTSSRLVNMCNREGDPACSAEPVFRFVARSIRAHQSDLSPTLISMLPKGYHAFVRSRSLLAAVETLFGEDDCLGSFRAAYRTRSPGEDEIFVRFEPGSWICTNRCLYLIDPGHAPEAHLLESIRTYRIRTLIRRSLEIRLKSGAVVTRPARDGRYMSAAQVAQVRQLSHDAAELAPRARRQSGH